MMDEVDQNINQDNYDEVPAWLTFIYVWLPRALKKNLYIILMLVPFIALSVLLIIWRNSVDWKLLLDFVSTLIWPTVVLISLAIFHQPLKAMIKEVKLKRIKTPIGAADFDTNPNQPPTLPSTEELIKDVSEVEPDAQSIEAVEDPEKQQLQENFDGLLLLYEFERSYRSIFGSQISALQRIAQYKAQSLNDLSPFYEEHVNKMNGSPFYQDAAGLFGFLVNNGFLSYSPNGQIYTITRKAELFLKYMQDQNMSLMKPF